jgi:hypothetical protein
MCSDSGVERLGAWIKPRHGQRSNGRITAASALPAQRRPEEAVQAAVKVGPASAHGEHRLAGCDLAAADTSPVVRLEEER